MESAILRATTTYYSIKMYYIPINLKNINELDTYCNNNITAVQLFDFNISLN